MGLVGSITRRPMCSSRGTTWWRRTFFYLSAERTRLFGDQKVDGPPDLIVEVLSPSTRSRDLTVKMDLYARTGVSEYWIVDPQTADISFHSRTAGGSFVPLPQERNRIRSGVLPEFVLDPNELIAGIE
jgi:Uma2 family endonuclease